MIFYSPSRPCGLVLLAMLVVFGAPAFAAADVDPAAAPPAKSSIAVESQSGSDAKIRSRLLQLFSALDGLGDVGVQVSGGVVALSGEVASGAAHDQALQIVRRIEGVAEVRDNINVSRNLRKRLGQLHERVTNQLLDIAAYLPLLAVAGVVLSVFWWVSGLVTRNAWLTRRFARNPFIRDLVRQAVRAAFLGIGVLLALEVLDASTLFTSLLGAAGVVGLAVGFALRDTVENYIASLLLSLRQPFARDDLVTIDGSEGRVVRLNARATVLLTLDGNHLRIPNAKVYKAVIVNYTRNPKRRFQFDVGVDTNQNLASAQRLAVSTLNDMKGVERDPAVVCLIESLGDSNVLLRIFGWVDQSSANFASVRSEAIRVVKGAFDRAGVVMPEPIYNVHVDGIVPNRTPAFSGSPLRKARPDKGVGPDEPKTAVGVERREDLECQVEDVRDSKEEDLLHSNAARE